MREVTEPQLPTDRRWYHLWPASTKEPRKDNFIPVHPLLQALFLYPESLGHHPDWPLSLQAELDKLSSQSVAVFFSACASLSVSIPGSGR